MKLVKGNTYRFTNQKEILVYTGKEGNWNQFGLLGDPTGRVWSELLDSDLYMIEEAK